MVPLMSLWTPILLSAVIVFVASSVVHMLLPFHKSDFRTLPSEDAVLEALRKVNIPPGDYMAPRPGSMKEMGTPAFKEKLARGPALVMTVWRGSPSMAGPLSAWFVYCVVVSIFAAYIASRALGAGAHYLSVFRFAGAAAFMCYAVALWQNTIWYRRNWTTTLKSTIDGLLYAMLTAGTFGWLWPR